jgi:hypothetical protein
LVPDNQLDRTAGFGLRESGLPNKRRGDAICAPFLKAFLKIKFGQSSSSSFSSSSSACSGQFEDEDDDENEQDSVSTPFSDAL